MNLTETKVQVKVVLFTFQEKNYKKPMSKFQLGLWRDRASPV
jgi:hypothetical protein